MAKHKNQGEERARRERIVNKKRIDHHTRAPCHHHVPSYKEAPIETISMEPRNSTIGAWRKPHTSP
jgi:hypothetical protein